jgi:hypothetical protein
MLFEVEYNPNNIRDRYRAHLAKKQAWENAQKVWEAFRRSEDPDHFELLPFYGTPGLSRRIPLAWKAINRYSRVIAEDITGKPAGYISPVLMDEDKYVFYYITGKRGENSFQPFEEVQEEVLGAWEDAERQKLRREYGLSFGKR